MGAAPRKPFSLSAAGVEQWVPRMFPPARDLQPRRRSSRRPSGLLGLPRPFAFPYTHREFLEDDAVRPADGAGPTPGAPLVASRPGQPGG